MYLLYLLQCVLGGGVGVGWGGLKGLDSEWSLRKFTFWIFFHKMLYLSLPFLPSDGGRRYSADETVMKVPVPSNKTLVPQVPATLM